MQVEALQGPPMGKVQRESLAFPVSGALPFQT